MDLDIIQDLSFLNFPPSIKIRSNNKDDVENVGCTTPTSSDNKIPPCAATTPPPPPQKRRRPPPTPSSHLVVRSCKRKLMTSLSKFEIIVNKEEIDRFFSSVYNQTMTSSTTAATTAPNRRRSFRKK
ncbi:unnamed protein product [Cochlearia groenlandica]